MVNKQGTHHDELMRGPGWLNGLGSCSARVAQWVRWLDYLTTHTSISPIRHGFALGFVNYKKGALYSQPQVIKLTSCLSMVGGSLLVLRTVVKELRSKMFGQHPGYFKAVFLKQTRIIIVSIYKYTVYIMFWIMMLYDCYYY
jgi:hypothetical protein